MIDLHCHILPGWDDGAADLGQAVELAEGLVSLGVTQVVATPHQPWRGKFLTAELLRERCKRLEESIQARRLPIRVVAAAEHHSSAVLELAQAGKLLPYPERTSILMEFPMAGLPPRWEELLFHLQVKGVCPVLAHIERIPEVQKNISLVEKFRARGCRLSLDVDSLVGGWSGEAENTARKLIAKHAVDLVTTDLHSPANVTQVQRGLDCLRGLIDENEFLGLTEHYPAGLLLAKQAVSGKE